jgi:replicative DNA helicase
VERAVAAIEHAVKYSGVEFVVVDYLQLLKGSGGTKYEQVSSVSTELKHAAVKHNVAIVVLAQLGREIEKRDNIPRLYDLKDSGQIEQDADQVMFVQWPLKNDPSHRPINEYRVFCAKNRNRAINQTVVELRFTPSRQLLREIPFEAMPNETPAFEDVNDR